MSDLSNRIASLTPEQRELLEKRLRTPSSRQLPVPVAIVGLGCRFPGGVESAGGYWNLLRGAVDAIGEVPADRWDNSLFFDPDPEAAGRISSRWGGFVADVDKFDAAYFGISPREAERMDPQQRVLLEVAVDALEDAGLPLDQIAGSDTGVFVGAHGHASDYLWLQYARPESIDPFTGTGTAHNLFAGRLAYVFDLRGPAIVVDTACSSSLAAVHLAVQSLRSGESSLALAAGVNLILGPHFSIAASRMHMLAPDGRCKAFDHRADGFVRGEGCGVVVLKRLTDAVRDGDPIRAVIRGTAMNQDGHTNGITAPNGLAQRAVIERALRDAGIQGSAVGFVEAHGTGTALGDPIEVEALSATVGQGASATAPCFVGSVKTNIGHLEGAAGIASLIKTVLVLERRQIPGNLHFTRLNPHIDVAGTRLSFPTSMQDWGLVPGGRIAGVSSFGWSGTNTHVVVEEAPKRPEAPAAESAPFLLPMSGRSAGALRGVLSRYLEEMAGLPEAQLRDFCRTAALRRTHHEYRAAVCGSNTGEVTTKLREKLATIDPRRVAGRPRVVFVFPGQGSQWLGMGRSLLADEPAFRQSIAECDTAIRKETGWSVVEVLNGDATIDDIGVLQPTLFAMQVALAKLWVSWGISPDAVVGHSMGEVAAAHVAGILDLDDATKIICRRSALLRRIAGRGAMALVELSADDARVACGIRADRVSVAVSNGPRSTVLSGDPATLREIVGELEAKGIYCRHVKVDVASHSPQVDELRTDLMGALAGIQPRAEAVSFFSTVAARGLAGTDLGPGYWVENLREPVRFHTSMRQLLADGLDTFIEVSPHPVLLPSIDDAIADHGADAVAVASSRRDAGERGEMLWGLARLYERGASPVWRALWRGKGAVASLPAYPWQRERFWIDGADPAAPATRASPVPEAERHEDTTTWLYTPRWIAAPRRRDEPSSEQGLWLLLADHGGRAEALARRLQAAGKVVWMAQLGDRFEAVGPSSFRIRADVQDDFERLLDLISGNPAPLLGIVHCWSLDAPANDATAAEIGAAQVPSCVAAIAIVKALTSRDLKRAARLTVVTAGAQSPDGRPPALAQAPIWGLGRVIAEEHPECWGGLVDLDPTLGPEASAEGLLAEIGGTDGEDAIALVGQTGRFSCRLQRLTPHSRRDFKCRPDSSYFISGGLGGVGLETARWLVDRGARHLVLAGRAGMPPRDQWDDTGDESFRFQVDAIRAIESRGATVYPVALDVADAAAVERVLREGDEAGRPPVRGIVHAAAVAEGCLIGQFEKSNLEKVLRPKLLGAAVLADAARHMELEFFVLYSSISSIAGQAGLASYAAANAFVDSLALVLAQRGVRALAVNWGVWTAVGHARSASAQRGIAEFAQRGIRGFGARQGTAALGLLMEGDAVNAMVAPVDWQRFGQYASQTRLPSIFRDLATSVPASTATSTAAAAAAAAWRAQLDAAGPEQRAPRLLVLLRSQLAEVLRLPEAQIDADTPMGAFGLESMTALELRKRIEVALGLRLSATVIWSYPTLSALARFLIGRLYPGTAPAPNEPEGPSAPVEAPAGLTDEQAIAALMADDGGSR